MRAVILDGSRKGENDLEKIRAALVDELGSCGYEIDVFELKDLNIAPCKGCFNCWIKTPGICIYRDDAQEVTKKIVQSALFILLSPVTFGGYSSELKKALDRSLSMMLPYFTRINGKTHHKKRYKSYPRLVVVGSLPAPDPELERIFGDLVSRNSTNAHAPNHAMIVITGDRNVKSIKQGIKTVLNDAGVSA